ncbi:MAG: LysR substrate-binding domain-containing protein [Actinomycetota bacterium]
MTFGQLRTFLEVARQGSIRGAAAMLMVSEPSVSAAVAALSKDIGAELLQREGRGIRLTGAGRELVKYASEILGLADQAARRVQEAAGKKGRLHLAAATTAGEYVLPPLLKLFRRKHPEVHIWMEVGNRVSTFEHLHSREADLAIGGRPPPDTKIVGESFLDNQLFVVGAPDHPLASEESVPPEMLAGETWLIREPGSGTRQALQEFFRSLSVESAATMELGSNGAVKQAAIAGLGITLMSAYAVAAEVASGTLSRIRVPGTPLKRAWYVNYLRDDPPSGSVSDFLDLIRSPQARRDVDDLFGLNKLGTTLEPA